MAKKTKGENKGETCALVVIIILLVAGIGFYFGRGFVVNMFGGEEDTNSQIEDRINTKPKKEEKPGLSIFQEKINEIKETIDKKDTKKEDFDEVEKVEDTTEKVKEKKTEDKKPENKEEIKKEAEKKNTKKSDNSKSSKKSKTKKISKEDANAIKVLENADRNNNTREADAELLEKVDRKNNMESAN